MKKWIPVGLALAAALLIGPAQADRDGSGNYTVPNTFTAGSTITAAGHNQNWSDIGDEMTNSLPRDGQAGMTGQFKAAVGSTDAPGISWSADTNTGLLSLGSGSGFSVIIDGVSVGSFTGAGFTGSVVNVTPPGLIFPYAGTSAPSGYLLCYGQAVSRETYSDLYAIIGTTYGSGDGSTTFNLPDLRGRVVAGQDDMGGSSANRLTGLTNGVNGDTFAAVGGLESFTLATTNVPSHTHSFSATTGSNGTHDHSYPNAGGTSASYGAGGSSAVDSSSGDTGEDGSHTHSVSGTTGTGSGSGTAMGHIQPTIILNYIIKI